MAKTATYSLIASNTLGTATSTITFSSIPATFTDLVLVCNLFSSGSTYSGIRFNGDTGTNYSLTDLYGDGGGGITSSRQSNISGGGSGPTMGSGNVLIYNILDYSNSSTYKNMLGRNANPDNGNFASVNAWRSTAAINSVTLYTGTADNWSIGSTLRLYGIQAGNA